MVYKLLSGCFELSVDFAEGTSGIPGFLVMGQVSSYSKGNKHIASVASFEVQYI